MHRSRRCACVRRTFRDDTGAGSTELAVAVPLLMLMMLLIIQFALWQYALAVATSAAQQGTQAARAQGAGPAAGPDRAHTVLDQLGAAVLTGTHVQTHTDPQTVTVQITGHAVSLVPGFAPSVNVHASGVLERYRP